MQPLLSAAIEPHGARARGQPADQAKADHHEQEREDIHQDVSSVRDSGRKAMMSSFQCSWEGSSAIPFSMISAECSCTSLGAAISPRLVSSPFGFHIVA
jgi:hypothetical protein